MNLNIHAALMVEIKTEKGYTQIKLPLPTGFANTVGIAKKFYV